MPVNYGQTGSEVHCGIWRSQSLANKASSSLGEAIATTSFRMKGVPRDDSINVPIEI
jgi:hypothetical protein